MTSPQTSVCAILFCLLLFSTAVHADPDEEEPSTGAGEHLFQTYCETCHSLSGTPIGPPLRGVEERASKEWISQFIRDPESQIEANDPRAKSLVEKYQVVMPGFPFLTDSEIASILEYVSSVHSTSVDESNREQERSRWKALMSLPTEPIPRSEYSISLEDFITIPPSSSRPPLARISNIRFLPQETEDRFYVIDQNGYLYRIENGESAKVLDLESQFPDFVRTPGHATGFGCLAFHPEYRTNGRIYLSHTEKNAPKRSDYTLAPEREVSVQYVISELTVTNPNDKEFTGSWRELLRIDMPHHIHGVQDIRFKPKIDKSDPDYGLLFIGVGDGGSTAKNAYELCASLESPLSSILRINPMGSNSRNGQYGIPDDNPYANFSKNSSTVWPEIYAKGFRNPHRLEWEPNGERRLIATDIGQNSFEEINIIKPGANYGWNDREGYVIFDKESRKLTEALPYSGTEDGNTYPAALYSHNEGNAISGGHIYNGDFLPLKGKFIFGDISSGRLFYTDMKSQEKGIAPIYELGVRNAAGDPTNLGELVGSKRVNLRIGVDAHGQWYILSKTDGKIRKVTRWQ